MLEARPRQGALELGPLGPWSVDAVDDGKWPRRVNGAERSATPRKFGGGSRRWDACGAEDGAPRSASSSSRRGRASPREAAAAGSRCGPGSRPGDGRERVSGERERVNGERDPASVGAVTRKREPPGVRGLSSSRMQPTDLNKQTFGSGVRRRHQTPPSPARCATDPRLASRDAHPGHGLSRRPRGARHSEDRAMDLAGLRPAACASRRGG